MDKRLDWADIARGIGIILVVFGHTLVPGLRDAYTGVRFVWSFIYNIHMPVFFFVSGWLFEKGLAHHPNKGEVIAGKARLLMLPYIMFSLFAYAVIFVSMKIPALASILSGGDYGSPTVRDAVHGILFYSGHVDQHLWFVYSLFIVFTLNVLLGRVMKSKIMLVVLLMLYISKALVIYPAILNYTASDLLFFSLARAMYANGRSAIVKKPIHLAIVVIVFVTSSVVYTYYDVSGIPNDAVRTAIYATRAVCSATGIVTVCTLSDMIAKTKLKPFFSVLGCYSYDIYLIHAPFLVSGLMGILLAYSPLPPLICCGAVTVTGILLPYLISRYIIRKIPLLSLILLGGAIRG